MLSFFVYVFIFGTIILVAFLFLMGLLTSRRHWNEPQDLHDPNVIDVKAIDVDDTDEPDKSDPLLKP